MGKSVIEAIGQKKALELMENAVLRAIEENQALGFGRISDEKKACTVGPMTTLPLGTGLHSSEQAGSLKKSVPIA